ncbi:MAG: hypothetical protein OXR62_08290 [Ahrensia sp.]|nr:hypothetical protein [Ahrensia sp.]
MTLNADRRLEVGDHVELLVTAHNAGNEMSSGELLRLVSFGGRIDFDASVDNRQVMPRELHREGGTVWYYPIRLPRLAAGQKSELKLFGRIIGAGRALLSVRTEEEDENGNLSFLLENFGQILGRRVSSNEPTERFLEVRRACVAQHGETNRQLLRDCVARELKPSRG